MFTWCVMPKSSRISLCSPFPLSSEDWRCSIIFWVRIEPNTFFITGVVLLHVRCFWLRYASSLALWLVIVLVMVATIIHSHQPWDSCQPTVYCSSWKSCSDLFQDPNQLIRASALRVLSSIRVTIIVPIMMLAIKEAASDMSPYVRKTAAHAIPKLYRWHDET